MPHDGRLLASNRFLTFSDASSDSVRIAFARLAEELGRKMILNIVMVGFFTSVTKLVDYEAAKQAVKASVPPGTEGLNLRAFDKGFEYGTNLTK